MLLHRVLLKYRNTLWQYSYGIIQTNKAAENEKIQGNKLPILVKIQRNNRAGRKETTD